MAIKRHGWPTPEGQGPKSIETSGDDLSMDPEFSQVPVDSQEHNSGTSAREPVLFDGEDQSDIPHPPTIIQIFVPAGQSAAYTNKAVAEAEAQHNEGEDMSSDTPTNFNPSHTNGAPETFTADQGQPEGGNHFQTADIAEGASIRGPGRWRRAARVIIHGVERPQRLETDSSVEVVSLDLTDTQLETSLITSDTSLLPVGISGRSLPNTLPVVFKSERPVPTINVISGVNRIRTAMVTETGIHPESGPMVPLFRAVEEQAEEIQLRATSEKLTRKEVVIAKAPLIGSPDKVADNREKSGVDEVVSTFFREIYHPNAMQDFMNYAGLTSPEHITSKRTRDGKRLIYIANDDALTLLFTKFNLKDTPTDSDRQYFSGQPAQITNAKELEAEVQKKPNGLRIKQVIVRPDGNAYYLEIENGTTSTEEEEEIGNEYKIRVWALTTRGAIHPVNGLASKHGGLLRARGTADAEEGSIEEQEGLGRGLLSLREPWTPLDVTRHHRRTLGMPVAEPTPNHFTHATPGVEVEDARSIRRPDQNYRTQGELTAGLTENNTQDTSKYTD